MRGDGPTGEERVYTPSPSRYAPRVFVTAQPTTATTTEVHACTSGWSERIVDARGNRWTTKPSRSSRT